MKATQLLSLLGLLQTSLSEVKLHFFQDSRPLSLFCKIPTKKGPQTSKWPISDCAFSRQCYNSFTGKSVRASYTFCYLSESDSYNQCTSLYGSTGLVKTFIVPLL